MSSRDDSTLYSGLSSASFAKNKKLKQRNLAKREEQHKQLSPAGELIRAEFAKEFVALGQDLGDLIGVDTDKEDVKSVMIGANLAKKRLMSVQTRILKILRETSPQDESEEENGTEL